MIDYTTFALANGLRVVHRREPSAAMAVVNVLYDTGSRDESRELTGVAHLFEHLMFGGSVNVADFDGEMERAGGVNNAWTSKDYTNFYDVVPVQNIEVALRLESDRMLGLSMSEESLRVQRSVVIEEFKQQCLNRPYGDAMHHLSAMLYAPEHPYSWPVIGLEPSHIARVTNEDVRRVFAEHYAPNNAVLSIVGNISLEDTRALVEKWFGDLPRRAIAPRRLPAPGFPTADVRKEVSGAVPQTMIIKAFAMRPYGEHDYFVADVITDILSSGQSSRFYQNLVLGSTGLYASADACIQGYMHEGAMLLTALLAEEGPEAEARAEELLMREARRLEALDAVTPYELERAIRRYETNYRMSNLRAETLAQSLADAVMKGEDFNEQPARQRSVTLDDVRRVAADIFESPSATLVYRPN